MYLQSLFIGFSGERIYLLLFGGAGNLKRVFTLDEGLPTSPGIHLNKLIRIVSQSKATFVVPVHNHPDGIPCPSNEDKRATDRIQQALQPIGVHLVDHFIIAGDRCTSILRGQEFQIP